MEYNLRVKIMSFNKMKEQAKEAVKKTTDKAEELANKAKEGVDVEAIKAKAEDAKSNINVESINGLDQKQKVMGGGILVAVLLMGFMLFGGSSHSVKVSNLANLFPTNGNNEEQCEALLNFKYDYWRLIDSQAPLQEMKDAMESVFVKVKREDIADKTGIEQQYYKQVWGAKASIDRQYGTKVKEKYLDASYRERKISGCAERMAEK